MPSVRFRLNGVEVSVDADPDRSLLDILRGPLGLTGPHFGCGAGECGACNVIIDGRAVSSCDAPLWSVAEKDVTTIEGLGDADHPHPLQRAFITEQALQCGYCVSGHFDQRGRAVEAESLAIQRRSQASARRQSLPLRFARPDGARGSTRGKRDGRRMNTPQPKLPVSLAANPKLSSWLRFSSDGQVTVSPGKVEIGQGIVTALAQIAADELDVDIARVQMVRASTAASPNEGVTSGSLSIQQSGRALRHACAEVRHIFLAAASERLGVGIDALDIEDGTISGPGNVRTSYFELADEVSLDRDVSPDVTPKSIEQRTLAGSSVQRLDIPDKVFARRRFIHDAALPGMLHGRVLRSELSGATLTGLKEDAARAVAGLVAIVRDGNFAGVVCDTENAAEVALKALRKGATWSGGETLPDENDLAAFLKSQPVESTVIDTRKAPSPGAKKPNRQTAIHAALHRACVDRAILRNRAVGCGQAFRSGRTARASTCCAPIWRWC